MASSSDAVLGEISAALADIVAQIEKPGLLGEICAALADILAHMEKPETPEPPEDYAPMGAAIGQQLRAALAELKAPVVNVQPAAITMQERSQAAPQVTVSPTIASPAGTQHRITFEKDSFGRITGGLITKL